MKKILKQFSLVITFLFLTLQIKAQCGFNINITATNNGCNETNNGSLNASIIGSGIYNDIYWLNDQEDTLSNTSFVNGLEAGNYIIFVTDSITECTQYRTSIITDYYNSPSILSTNISCPSCEDGSAEIFINNNNYNFLWDDIYVQETQTATDLVEGFYSATISDALNCNKILSTQIENCGENLDITYSATPPTCINCNDAMLSASVSGGTGSLSYQWDDAALQTTATATGLDYKNNFMLTVTDSLGCQNTLFIDSSAFCRAGINPNITLTQPSCSTCPDGSATLNPSGLHGPFSFLWTNTGSTIDSIVSQLPDSFEVIITDTINCKLSTIIELEYCYNTIVIELDSFVLNNQNVLADSVHNNDNFNPSEFNSCILVRNALHGHVILNPNGSFSYTANHSFNGFDFFSYTIFTDCGFTDTVNAYINVQNQDLVWPGDADNNGIVDNFDLLPISVFYDSTGIARTGATNNYIGQFANNFGAFEINGANIKHADCNGSGLIDSADLNVIDLNYDAFHSLVDEGIAGDIPLKIIGPDTVRAGDTVEFKIHLGTTDFPASNVYALAYTFNINKDLINQNYFEARFNDSWFTPDNNRISFAKGILSKGKIDIAQGGKNGTNTSGDGEIGSIIIVIEEDLDDVFGGNLVTIDQVRLVQNNEVPVYTKNDTTRFDIITKINKLKANESEIPFILSPNPCQDKLNISLSKKGDYEIELLNVLGEIIYSKSISNTDHYTMKSKFTNGLYFLKLKQGEKESIQKVVFYK